MFVGLPPRCKCPSTTARASLPVRFWISSATSRLTPPKRASRFCSLSRECWRTSHQPLAPSATTTIVKCRPACWRSAIFANAVVVEWNLRQENDVGSPSQTGIDGDPSRVAPHHFQNHHAAVALGGTVQAVKRIGSASDRGVETKRHSRGGQIVVNRLRHADDRQPMFIQLLRNRERTIPANRDSGRTARISAKPRSVSSISSIGN